MPRALSKRAIADHTSETWTEDALRRLGRDSDAAIAADLEITREAVRQKRVAMGIGRAKVRGPAPRAGEAATIRRTVRLTPTEDRAFRDGADAAGIKGDDGRGLLWLRQLGRQARGL